MINILLYQPDIPQNTAAILRLSACFGFNVHIIEPCSFNINDSRFRRVVMDYVKLVKVYRYENFDNFKNKNSNSRVILMTTKAKKSYHKFFFKKNDFLLFGRESAGVPKKIHSQVEKRLKIPLLKKARSLNIVVSAAIVSSEAIRQLKFYE